MKFLFTTITLLLTFALFAQEPPREKGYQYSLNIGTNDLEDEVFVELTVPEGAYGDKVVFHMPKIVPGTYKSYDYGRFVQTLTAYDKKNEKLKVTRADFNTWVIDGARYIQKITYYVEDTWDTFKNNPVFEPAGTNFSDKEVYLINQSGFFGWIEGFEKLPYYLTIEHPESFYGSTVMQRLRSDADTDVFRAKNYHELIDRPIMYCVPDTAGFDMGGTRVTVSVYCKSGLIKAKNAKDELQQLMKAQMAYLGGKLPVDKYIFLVYANEKPFLSKSSGALEHNQCCVICMPEEEAGKFYRQVRDIAAHEFLHIVTPLNIHSKEIHNFDYLNPKMSRHLWMYEGVTEYMSLHCQQRVGMITPAQFFDQMSNKIHFAKVFDEKIPFTTLSENCLMDPYRKQYMNVYQKGALIAMCLDLILLKNSKGKFNLVQLMNTLSTEFGPDKPFDDEALFEKIESLTSKEAGDFLRTCVADVNALPIKELTAAAGVLYQEQGTKKDISALGGLENNVLKTDQDGRFYVNNTERLDAFGRDFLKFEKGDVLKTWNGEELDAKNCYNILLKYVSRAKRGDNLEVTVIRNGQQVPLSATIVPVMIQAEHVFNLMEKPDEEARVIRQAWLGII